MKGESKPNGMTCICAVGIRARSEEIGTCNIPCCVRHLHALFHKTALARLILPGRREKTEAVLSLLEGVFFLVIDVSVWRCPE